MKKHLKEILTKMFEMVGEDSSDIETYVEDPHWYIKNEWTKQQESDFKCWFYKYLKSNALAKKELEIKFKNKLYILKFVNSFVLNYGWKTL